MSEFNSRVFIEEFKKSMRDILEQNRMQIQGGVGAIQSPNPLPDPKEMLQELKAIGSHLKSQGKAKMDAGTQAIKSGLGAFGSTLGEVKDQIVTQTKVLQLKSMDTLSKAKGKVQDKYIEGMLLTGSVLSVFRSKLVKLGGAFGNFGTKIKDAFSLLGMWATDTIKLTKNMHANLYENVLTYRVMTNLAHEVIDGIKWSAQKLKQISNSLRIFGVGIGDIVTGTFSKLKSFGKRIFGKREGSDKAEMKEMQTQTKNQRTSIALLKSMNGFMKDQMANTKAMWRLMFTNSAKGKDKKVSSSAQKDEEGTDGGGGLFGLLKGLGGLLLKPFKMLKMLALPLIKLLTRGFMGIFGKKMFNRLGGGFKKFGRLFKKGFLKIFGAKAFKKVFSGKLLKGMFKGFGKTLAKIGGKALLTGVKFIPFLGWAVAIGDALWGAITGWMDAGKFFGGKEATLGQKISSALAKVLTLGLLPDSWTGKVAQTIHKVGAWIGDAVGNTFKWFKNAFVKGWDMAKSVFGGVVDFMKTGVVNAFDSVKNAIKNAFNTILNFARGFINKIKKLNPATWFDNAPSDEEIQENIRKGIEFQKRQRAKNQSSAPVEVQQETTEDRLRMLSDKSLKKGNAEGKKMQVLMEFMVGDFADVMSNKIAVAMDGGDISSVQAPNYEVFK